MMFTKAASMLLLFALLLPTSISVLAQTQTTGRLAGTVRDPNGAVIVAAEVTVSNNATGQERKVITDDEGNYNVSLLAPGTIE
jgi:Carboxypeptidase regulatory-like domain